MLVLSVTKKPSQSTLPPLVITPSPPWFMTLWYGLLHGFIILLLLLFFTPNTWLFLMIAGVLLSFFYVSAFYFNNRQVQLLYLDNGEWFVCYKGDDSQHKRPVTLLNGGFFSPLITVLPFKEQTATGKKTQVVFLPMAVDKELFRQLRVRVGFGEGLN